MNSVTSFKFVITNDKSPDRVYYNVQTRKNTYSCKYCHLLYDGEEFENHYQSCENYQQIARLSQIPC